MTSRFDTIQTDRLLMRRWRDSDREPFAALNGDPETMRYFPATLDRSASSAGGWLGTPSQAVMRRIGLTEVSRFDHPRIPTGHPLCPHVLFHLASPAASAS